MTDIFENNCLPNILQLQASVRFLVSRTSAQGATKQCTSVSADIQTVKFTKCGLVLELVCSAVPGHTLAFPEVAWCLQKGLCFLLCVSAEKVSSLGKDWHRPCLRCERCSKTLAPGSHAEVTLSIERPVDSHMTKTAQKYIANFKFYCILGMYFNLNHLYFANYKNTFWHSLALQSTFWDLYAFKGLN